MPSHLDIVNDSVRTNGRDTRAALTTGFINPETLNPPPPPTEAKYEMWTEEHSAKSRARRENRENREKPPTVADVPDFDVETHFQEKVKEKEKPKWKIW